MQLDRKVKLPKLDKMKNTVKFAALILLLVFCTLIQAQPGPGPTNDVPAVGSAGTNQVLVVGERREQIRAACIAGRRCLCGKIIRVVPGGLVVDSGYTDLMREPLNKSWLVPGTATASRTPNLIEGNEPDCVAVGPVFLSNLPKSRGAKPKLYDYVILTGYPAGQFTYATVGTVTHTVRRFTGTLAAAVDLNVAVEVQQADEAGKK